MLWFESLAAQHSNSQVWFQLDDLPWAPSYVFNADGSAVTLNTKLNDAWWPKVLAATGSKNWREPPALCQPDRSPVAEALSLCLCTGMPFSDRIHSLPHLFTTNSSWLFHMQNGSKPVPMFTGKAGELNP